MKKILAIGNSFSQDATRYLMPIAESADEPLFVRNLFIGGCSLERHAQNLFSGEEAYDYEENASQIARISLPDALKADDWDYVTVQQVSGLSGIEESYCPYLEQLLEAIHMQCPHAKVVFHRTWAYEIDSSHPDFSRYGNDQQRMFDSIVKTSQKYAEQFDLPIIPVGDLIERLRKTNTFDYAHGGMSLHRDGFHLSLDYGRYAAGLAWFCFFTGHSPFDSPFAPKDTDMRVIQVIRDETARLFLN